MLKEALIASKLLGSGGGGGGSQFKLYYWVSGSAPTEWNTSDVLRLPQSALPAYFMVGIFETQEIAKIDSVTINRSDDHIIAQAEGGDQQVIIYADAIKSEIGDTADVTITGGGNTFVVHCLVEEA